MKEILVLLKVIKDLQEQKQKLQSQLRYERMQTQKLGVKLDQAYDVLLDHQIDPSFLNDTWYDRELPF